MSPRDVSQHPPPRRRRAGRGVLLIAVLVALALGSTAGDLWAAGGGKPATTLVNVADTRAMEPGLSRWIADVYNHSLWIYGLLVVGIMCTMGLLLGLATDRVVGLLGINLGRMTHHE
jgi:hypothetical protein